MAAQAKRPLMFRHVLFVGRACLAIKHFHQHVIQAGWRDRFGEERRKTEFTDIALRNAMPKRRHQHVGWRLAQRQLA